MLTYESGPCIEGSCNPLKVGGGYIVKWRRGIETGSEAWGSKQDLKPGNENFFKDEIYHFFRKLCVFKDKYLH